MLDDRRDHDHDHYRRHNNHHSEPPKPVFPMLKMNRDDNLFTTAFSDMVQCRIISFE